MSDSTPRFKKLHPDAIIPRRHYADDIGWDLTIRSDHPITVSPGEFVDLPCDLAVELPAGTWGLLIGRSSALRKHGLIISQGVIDQGYTGPLFAGAFNACSWPVVVGHGDRLSQLIVVPRYDPIAVEPIEVQQLRRTARGTAGFGSTDRVAG